jgi:hypothetical protein
MLVDRRVLAGAAGLALLLAACGSASTPSAAPATGGATAPAAVTEEPAATAEVDPTEAPEVSLAPGAAGDLEGMLPDQAGGLTFTKTSFDGSQLGLAGLGMDAGDLTPILEKHNKTVSDVRFAMATATDATTPAVVIAFQIRGVDGKEMQELLTGGSDSLTPATIAGKQVLTAGSDMMGGAFYTRDDVAYSVILATPDALEAIIAALP